MWLFGYGSLVWRPNFNFEDRAEGFIRGYARRFWQGSPDHRGVPEAPGRVVTLISDPPGECWGVAYRLESREADRILAAVDHRERAGYVRTQLPVHLRRGETETAVVYFADDQNPNWLGPAPVNQIAEQVHRARGPSGSNTEYVLRLAETLHAMGVTDEHVFAVEAALNPLQAD